MMSDRFSAALLLAVAASILSPVTSNPWHGIVLAILAFTTTFCGVHALIRCLTQQGGEGGKPV
jgi:hypothetical protein